MARVRFNQMALFWESSSVHPSHFNSRTFIAFSRETIKVQMWCLSNIQSPKMLLSGWILKAEMYLSLAMISYNILLVGCWFESSVLDAAIDGHRSSKLIGGETRWKSRFELSVIWRGCCVAAGVKGDVASSNIVGGREDCVFTGSYRIAQLSEKG